MRLETKFLRLRTPVELGSRFGDWQVCWLGGWTRHRLSYLVMLTAFRNDSDHRSVLKAVADSGGKPGGGFGLP